MSFTATWPSTLRIYCTFCQSVMQFLLSLQVFKFGLTLDRYESRFKENTFVTSVRIRIIETQTHY
jgi:hypothetical protein